LDAGVGNDQATLFIEGVNRRVPPQIDQPRVGPELLATHRVSSAAQGELRTGGPRIAHDLDERVEPGRLEQPRHMGRIELRMDVVDQKAAHGARR
jgi:hypothetical protein